MPSNSRTGSRTVAKDGTRLFYFRDPDDHNLEVIYFPPGKGDPRWQEKTDKLFLGIDHTAIAVAHTDASLRFYSDLLGFRKAGESENYGTEQEHLNQIFGGTRCGLIWLRREWKFGKRS